MAMFREDFSMSRTIYITHADRERLIKLIQKEQEFNPRNRQYLKQLKQELERATIVDSSEVPRDIITMNSKVRLRDLDTDDEMEYTLVYPEDAKLSEGKISVLAPVGTAILGYREGDIVEWKIPDGVVRLKVEKLLYQPEAAGNYE